MRRAALILLGVGLLLIGACSKDKNPVKPEQKTDSSFLTENIKEKPTYFSLEEMQPVQTYDISFVNGARELALKLNGGSSGSAGVTAKVLGVVDFNAEANVDSGFTADTADSLVIGERWYNYDFTTHTVSSKMEIYLVKSADYSVYKVRIDSFGTDSYSITYAKVDENGKPTEVKTAVVPASDGNPGQFSLSTGTVLQQDTWDIAFLTIPLFVPELNASILNPGARINSAAGVEVATVEGVVFNDLKSVPAGLTFKIDTGDSLALGDTIYNYNSQNHRLTPPDVVYIVKTVNGKYAKVQVTSYYDPDTGVSGIVNFNAVLLN